MVRAERADHDALTARLVCPALELDIDALPEDVVATARRCVLDWLGVSLAGWSNPLVKALVEEVEDQGGNPLATLVGSGRKATLDQAALVNGAASHVLDFDDVHPASRVHPSAPLLSAILAVAEHGKMTGGDVIAAFVAGVEVQSRLGLYMGDDHYAAGWHNTATLGTFGSTVAVGRLIGLDLDAACHAVGIAGALASGLRASFGTMSKPLQVGRAAVNGLLAARLARRGVDGCVDLLERAGGFGELFGKRRSTAAAFADPEGFQIRGIVFKHHASCFGTHAPIEAALRLGERVSAIEEIDAIEVTVEPQYLSVCNFTEPRNETEARFSIAHSVALALGKQSTTRAESFSAAGINRPETVRLRRRIVVRGSPDMPRANSSVQVRLKQGAVLTAHADAKAQDRGSDANIRLESKFRSITAQLLEPAAQEEIVAICRNLENLDDIAQLMSLCASPPGRGG